MHNRRSSLSSAVSRNDDLVDEMIEEDGHKKQKDHDHVLMIGTGLLATKHQQQRPGSIKSSGQSKLFPHRRTLKESGKYASSN